MFGCHLSTSNNNSKTQLESLLTSYSLYNPVNFPTRIDKKSATAIDIFINKCKTTNYTIFPIVNGLSDHDAQLLLLNNFTARVMNGQHYFKRQINGMSIEDFKIRLSYETWDDIFTDGDVDQIFNIFFYYNLRAFNSTFSFRRTFYKYDNKAWLTVEIRNLCHHKRSLHMLCRNIASPALLAYYKRYSKVLREKMKIAKRTYCDTLPKSLRAGILEAAYPIVF
jgi:hypothetical protein